MGGVLWVFRHSEVVVKLDTDSSFGLQLFVVEAIDLSVRLDNMINALKVESIEKGFIESYPNRNTICVMREQDLWNESIRYSTPMDE